MVKKSIKNFKEAEGYLYDIPRFTSKHGIEETKVFLEKLGSPDLSMKIIHVAGTNGKGSVCAYLDSVLRKAGLKVGLFTSPHLVDICERFRINGENISYGEFYSEFINIYDSLDWEAIEKDKPGAYHPTFFEFLFFMAMELFKKAGVEWCILETGLGGLLDATNSVHTKEAAVITRIDLDHMEYLGNTKAEIAVQKAGIIGSGKPYVYGDFVPEASSAIISEAEKKGAGKAYPAGPANIKVLQNLPERVDFCLVDGYYKNVYLCLDTIASYQAENASLAVKAIEAAGLETVVTPEILKEGLMECHWAGRMEEVLEGVYVDGAHNPDGIRAFLDTVAKDKEGTKRILVFGVVGDKDYSGMIGEIARSGYFESVLVTPLKTGRSADVGSIAGVFAGCGMKTEVFQDSVKALKEAIKKKKDIEKDAPERFPGVRIYITGSLYLVGEIKEYVEF